MQLIMAVVTIALGIVLGMYLTSIFLKGRAGA